MQTFKVGDIFFDEEGTFIRIKEITDTNVRYAVKYFDESAYCESPDWDITIDFFSFELALGKFRPYTKVAYLLYNKGPISKFLKIPKGSN